jgi:hypothetical protein
VFISARSQSRADAAIQKLVEQTGKPADTFRVMLFDNNKPETVKQAIEALPDQVVLDAVVLNAGGLPKTPDDVPKTALGLSELYAMNVHGHAILVHGLLDSGNLAPGATVMFAGTEAARGIPAMRMALPTLPDGHGDLVSTIDAVSKGEHAGKGYDPMVDYGLVKLIGTSWMQHLAEHHGLRALTVSPGFTGGTAAMDKLPAFQQFMFRYVALPIMKWRGDAHELEFGAKRYVQALEDDALQAGNFYASAGGRISGPLTLQGPDLQPLLGDASFHAAVASVIDGQVARA